MSFSEEALRLAEVTKGVRNILERQRNSNKDKVLKQSKIYSLDRKALSLNKIEVNKLLRKLKKKIKSDKEHVIRYGKTEINHQMGNRCIEHK